MALDVETAKQHRAYMKAVEEYGVKAMGPPPEGVAETWIDITLPDGWVSRTAIVYPVPAAGESKACPLIVNFHGGGFTFGYPGQVLLPARAYALHFGAITVCPSYKFIPENPFPASIHSAWEVCAWAANPKNLSEGPLKDTNVTFDPELGFITAGLSAGGNMACAIPGIQALAPGDPKLTEGLTPMPAKITGVFAGLPSVLCEEMVPERFKGLFLSREENNNIGGDGLSKNDIKTVEEGLQADVFSPWWSAINGDFSSPEVCKRHPDKVFIHAGGKDPLRDDAVIYDKWLRELGVAESRLVVLDDMPHSGWVSSTKPWLRRDWPPHIQQKLKETTLDGMSWVLGRSWDKESSSKDSRY